MDYLRNECFTLPMVSQEEEQFFLWWLSACFFICQGFPLAYHHSGRKRGQRVEDVEIGEEGRQDHRQALSQVSGPLQRDQCDRYAVPQYHQVLHNGTHPVPFQCIYELHSSPETVKERLHSWKKSSNTLFQISRMPCFAFPTARYVIQV